mmetsp:Transcript_9949/g.37105  ORF Transcript_9949/g.37105 Transcript_9949/m.37105 type:complete len:87 (+) Transcript_9949:4451-4711(+)
MSGRDQWKCVPKAKCHSLAHTRSGHQHMETINKHQLILPQYEWIYETSGFFDFFSAAHTLLGFMSTVPHVQRGITLHMLQSVPRHT